jgi:hypothetical protein
MMLGAPTAFGATPVGLQGVSQLTLPDDVVALEVWSHPDGDRLVALTADSIYAVDAVSNTSTHWLDVGGVALRTAGEQVYVCGPSGLRKLHNTSASPVWEGVCERVELGASIWLQTAGELIALGWSDYQELSRQPLEEEMSWGLVGGHPAQWRGDPASIQLQSAIGQTTISPTEPLKTVISGAASLKWLAADGASLIDSVEGALSLEPAVDHLLLLENQQLPYAAVYVESRAIGLLDADGKSQVLLPTMSRPDRVVAGDFNHDGCLDFVVSGKAASWVQGRCESEAAVSAKRLEEAIETLDLGQDWFTHDLPLGGEVRLRLAVSEGEILSVTGLPPSIVFREGNLEGKAQDIGVYTITAMVADPNGGFSARGFNLRIGGAEAVAAALPRPSAVEKPKKKGPDCLMGVGVMLGMASARTDWLNLTGEPKGFGSPTVSLMCGRTTEKKLRFIYGADSTPTALISDGQLKLAMGTVGVHLGSPTLGAGLYASLGLVSASTGLRVLWLPATTKRGRPHGLDLRLGWLAATPDAGEVSAAYTWQLGKRPKKEER